MCSCALEWGFRHSIRNDNTQSTYRSWLSDWPESRRSKIASSRRIWLSYPAELNTLYMFLFLSLSLFFNLCAIVWTSEIVDLIFPDHVIAYIPYLQEIGIMAVCAFFLSRSLYKCVWMDVCVCACVSEHHILSRRSITPHSLTTSYKQDQRKLEWKCLKYHYNASQCLLLISLGLVGFCMIHPRNEPPQQHCVFGMPFEFIQTISKQQQNPQILAWLLAFFPYPT